MKIVIYSYVQGIYGSKMIANDCNKCYSKNLKLLSNNKIILLY